jgi:hypothetical protein
MTRWVFSVLAQDCVTCNSNKNLIGSVEISVQDLFNKFECKELIVLKQPPNSQKQIAGGLRVLGITHYDAETTEGKVLIIMATCCYLSAFNTYLHFDYSSIQVRRVLKAVFAKLDKNKKGTLVPQHDTHYSSIRYLR